MLKVRNNINMASNIVTKVALGMLYKVKPDDRYSQKVGDEWEINGD